MTFSWALPSHCCLLAASSQPCRAGAAPAFRKSTFCAGSQSIIQHQAVALLGEESFPLDFGKCPWFSPSFRDSLQNGGCCSWTGPSNIWGLGACACVTQDAAPDCPSWDGAGEDQGFLPPWETKGTDARRSWSQACQSCWWAQQLKFWTGSRVGINEVVNIQVVNIHPVEKLEWSGRGLKDVSTCSGRSGHTSWWCWLPENPFCASFSVSKMDFLVEFLLIPFLHISVVLFCELCSETSLPWWILGMVLCLK